MANDSLLEDFRKNNPDQNPAANQGSSRPVIIESPGTKARRDAEKARKAVIRAVQDGYSTTTLSEETQEKPGKP